MGSLENLYPQYIRIMSRAKIFDELYHLQPDDLSNQAQDVTVSNVSRLGLEGMQMVLHFQGRRKRLVLTPEQYRQLVQAAQTAHPTEWLHQQLTLSVRKDAQNISHIVIFTKQERGIASTASWIRTRLSPSTVRSIVLVLLLFCFLVLAFGIIYALENDIEIIQLLERIQNRF
ncbi:MAG: hypothetical protein AAF639_45615 [Chloroflexota bacterium]